MTLIIMINKDFIRLNGRFYKQFILLSLLLFSCTQKQKQTHTNTFAQKVVEAKGYLVPKDSVQEPKTILAGKPEIVKVGKPKVVLTNTNIRIAINTNIHLAGTPRVCTPGTDTFLFPKTVPALDTPKLAGIPEVTIAKDLHINDNNPQSFSSFSKLQGLKIGVIGCMLQDKSGNLWFGTDGGGVSKYDGKSFTHFTDKEGLSNNYVWAMLEDKSGNLWFGTDGGVSKYDGKSFTHFTDKEGLSNNNVRSILEDKSGNLWFGTVGGGVSKYDGNRVEAIEVAEKRGEIIPQRTQQDLKREDGKLVKSFTHFTEKQGLSNNNVRSILEDKSGNLWFGTLGGGVSKYDGKSFTRLTDKEGLSNNYVWSILEDKSGNLWFGTLGGGGVSKYDGKCFTHFTDKEGLSNNNVLSILEDKSGNLWFGTNGGGVSNYDGKSFTHYTDKEGLSNNNVWSILEDKSGNLWFGTNGGGVSKYDGKSFTHFTDKEGLSNNYVGAMLEDKSGNLWFGTFGGVSKYDGKSFTHFTGKEGLSNNDVWSILEDKIGNLWFGTDGDGVIKYDGKSFTHFTDKEGLSNNNVYSMLEDKRGNLWFGTSGGGISKYDGKSFTHFTDKEGLSNNNVYSMLEDKSGSLWFGTDGGGVSKYDGKSFTHFTYKEGLSNNNVSSISEDKNGNLWFGTRFGLSKLSAAVIASFSAKQSQASNEIASPLPRKMEGSRNDDVLFKNYMYDDGFYGIGCNGGKTICEDRNGTLWIGANDRLTAFHPASDAPDTIPPNIQLTNVNLFNENIAWVNFSKVSNFGKVGVGINEVDMAKDTSFTLGNGVTVGNFQFDSTSRWYGIPVNLSLAYNNNNITFNFIGITTKSPKKVKYKYMLAGLDENWSALTNRTEAPYGNLPQGTYIFKVKAMNSEGYWSNEFNYTFTIRPPWWKTWWFRSFLGIIIVGSVVGYFHYRTAALRKRQKELEQTVEERTDELVQKNIIVEKQKEVVEEKNREITQSIEYALRIQTAILPPQKIVKQYLENSFILYKPKDIVAGDFYWMETIQFENENQIILFAACDCTGHGVPGAMVSLVCHNALNRAVREFGLTQPAAILDKTAEIVIENFSKSEEDIKDGMDISLCSLTFSKVSNFGKVELQWAGANNPLWLMQNGELIETKADKQPIGMYEDNHPFTNHEFTLNTGDTIYIFSDGFADQFGGEKGEKKLTRKRFKELLFSIQQKSMPEQGLALEKFILDYRKNIEQIDDILVIGVRV